MQVSAIGWAFAATLLSSGCVVRSAEGPPSHQDGPLDTGPGEDTDPEDTDPEDTGGHWLDSAPYHPDTAIDTACVPSEHDAPPSADAPTVLEPCNGGEYFFPLVDGDVLFAATSSRCTGDPNGYGLAVINPYLTTVETEVPWNAANGSYAAANSGGDLVVALGETTSAGTFYRYSFSSAFVGVPYGALEDTHSMRRITSANSAFLVGGPYVFGNLGAVAVFLEPPEEEVTFWDADVIHEPPGSCPNCYFGEILQGVGDVTGDGVDDVLLGGGGLWFVDGDSLSIDGGVREAAVSVSAGASASIWSISNVGDFDGDGLDDYATSSDGGVGSGKIEVMRGGGTAPIVRVLGYTDFLPRISEGVTAVGDVDGDGRSTIVVENAGWGLTADELWMVDGGICGVALLSDVGTPMEVPENMSFNGAVGGNRFLAVPTHPSDDEDGAEVPMWIYSWD